MASSITLPFEDYKEFILKDRLNINNRYGNFTIDDVTSNDYKAKVSVAYGSSSIPIGEITFNITNSTAFHHFIYNKSGKPFQVLSNKGFKDHSPKFIQDEEYALILHWSNKIDVIILNSRDTSIYDLGEIVLEDEQTLEEAIALSARTQIPTLESIPGHDILFIADKITMFDSKLIKKGLFKFIGGKGTFTNGAGRGNITNQHIKLIALEDITNEIIEVTYDELKNIVDNSLLKIGQKYRITDFSTIYYQLETNLLSTDEPSLTAPVEPLIVTARDINTFEDVAFSNNYPSDYIKYKFNDGTNYTKGTITRREGEIKANFDWRVIKFRLYKLNIPDFNEAETYVVNDIVKIPNTDDVNKDFDCYIHINSTDSTNPNNADTSNTAIINSKVWMKLSKDLTKDYLVGESFNSFSNYTYDVNEYQDFVANSGTASNVEIEYGVVLFGECFDSIIKRYDTNSASAIVREVMSVNGVFNSNLYIKNSIIYNVKNVNYSFDTSLIIDFISDKHYHPVQYTYRRSQISHKHISHFYRCTFDNFSLLSFKDKGEDTFYLVVGGGGTITMQGVKIDYSTIVTKNILTIRGKMVENYGEIVFNSPKDNLSFPNRYLRFYNLEGILILNAPLTEVLIDASIEDIISGDNAMGIYLEFNTPFKACSFKKDPSYGINDYHKLNFDLVTKSATNEILLKPQTSYKKITHYNSMNGGRFFYYEADENGVLTPVQYI